MTEAEASTAPPLLYRRHRTTWLLLAALLLTGFAARLYRLDEEPHSLWTIQQYRSALIARMFSYQFQGDALPEWRREVARQNRAVCMPYLQPPVLEVLTGAAWSRMSREAFWVPRLLTITCWTLGAFFLFHLARRFGPPEAALIGTAVFLFLPYAQVMSRNFQTEPLGVMCLIGSLLTLARYHERPIPGRLVECSLAAALAILIKLPYAALIGPAFGLMALRRQGLAGLLRSHHTWAFGLTALMPAALYYVAFGAVEGFSSRMASHHFQPQLLTQLFFWKGWIGRILDVAGPAVLILGAAGGLMALRTGAGALLLGCGIGYLCQSIVFTWATPTHEYYQLQFLVLLCLGVAALAGTLLLRVRGQLTAWQSRALLPLAGLCVLAAIRDAPWRPQPRPDIARFKVVAQEIGSIVGHGSDLVMLDHDYGMTLIYFAELGGGVIWPFSEDFLTQERLRGGTPMTVEERFRKIVASRKPKFFVVRLLREYERQRELKAFLESNFPVLARTPDYIIFDLEPAPPARVRQPDVTSDRVNRRLPDELTGMRSTISTWISASAPTTASNSSRQRPT